MLKIGNGLTAYDPARGDSTAAHKNLFDKDGEAFLQSLAQELRLDPGAYDIRSNLQSAAQCGEVVLHADHLYVQLHEAMEVEVMFRHCDGREDLIGNENHFVAFKRLRSPEAEADFLDECKQLMAA